MNSNNDNNEVAEAIAYPGRSQDTPEPQLLAELPRPPRTMQELMRFAVEAIKPEDAAGYPDYGVMNEERMLRSVMLAAKLEDCPVDSEFEPMSDERRTFLEEAIKNMTSNLAEVMSKSIKVLSNAERIHSIQLGETLPDDIQSAFSNLLEITDDIDVANDFYKLGGFSIFPVCFGSENEQIRLLANSVLAEVCQNNPYCQERALDCGLLNVLLNLVNTERRLVLSKCLSAISCMCREYEPASRELIAQGGCKTVSQLLTTADEPMVRTKAAFLIRYLTYTYPEAKEQFIQLNIINTIAEQLKIGRDNTSEHLLSIMQNLVQDENPTVLAQCRKPHLTLKTVLEKHLEHTDLVYDIFKEEKESCEEILKKVFENYTEIDFAEEVADR